MTGPRPTDGLPIGQVLQGDCLALLPTLAAESVHAVVTDPPYGLHFMGQAWDRFGRVKRTVTQPDKGRNLGSAIAHEAGSYDTRRNAEYGRFMQRVARELYRVLKPGGHVAMSGAPRRFHWQALALEMAGFEVRDTLCWLFGQGFPKSLDVGKAIDREAGAEREVVGENPNRLGRAAQREGSGWARPWQHDSEAGAKKLTVPATPESAAWDGWGTALKPGWEPILLARKPLERGLTVARNVLKHGTGALNIGACRLETAGPSPSVEKRKGKPLPAPSGIWPMHPDRSAWGEPHSGEEIGRWPADVALDEEAAALLDAQSGASRFFYTAKASRGEREAGLRDGARLSLRKGFEKFIAEWREGEAGAGALGEAEAGWLTSKPDGGGRGVGVRNSHPT
jgi:site-specific DNA-methyltransferase (adenine-specific)